MLCFFLCVLSHDGNGDDHGVRRAETARALARWLHIGASHEATYTLHWAMCHLWHQPGGMVFAFTIDFITFYYILVVKYIN